MTGDQNQSWESFSPIQPPTFAPAVCSPQVQPESRGVGISLPCTLRDYELVELIGRGGMGSVYKAVHQNLKRTVALKVLPLTLLDSEQATRRFYREMEAIGRLNHPHIVQAFDAGAANEVHYLAMEFMDGSDLQRICQRWGPLPVADAAEVVRQVADGLSHAHERGMIHRDLKPSNLLVNLQGEVKIADLGLARLRTEKGGAISGSNDILGTADYIAPEQITAGRHIDERADLYAIGCTLYQLLAGYPPFHGQKYDTVSKRLLAHMQETPPPLNRKDIPKPLAQIVRRLLEKDREQRIASARILRDEITAFCAGADLKRLVQQEPCESGNSFSALQSTATHGSPSVDTSRFSNMRLQKAVLPSAVLLALLAVIGGGLALWRSLIAIPLVTGPVEPRRIASVVALPEPRTIEDLQSSELRPHVIYRLLNKEPAKVFWPPDSHLVGPLFSADQKQLTVSCQGVGLLSIGNAPFDRYTLQMDLFQTNWIGGVGIFLGLRTVEDADAPHWLFQRLELRPNLGRQRDEYPLMFWRSKVKVTLNQFGQPEFQALTDHSVPVKAAINREHELKLTVSSRGLKLLNWGGEELTDLCTAQVNSHYRAEDYCGPFGIYCFQSDGTFRNASIEFHPLQNLRELPADP